MKDKIYFESMFFIQNQKYEEALRHLLTLKENTNVDHETDYYLNISKKIVFCSEIIGYQDLLIENLEEFYSIISFQNQDSELIFALECKLAGFYIYNMRLE